MEFVILSCGMLITLQNVILKKEWNSVGSASAALCQVALALQVSADRHGRYRFYTILATQHGRWTAVQKKE